MKGYQRLDTKQFKAAGICSLQLLLCVLHLYLILSSSILYSCYVENYDCKHTLQDEPLMNSGANHMRGLLVALRVSKCF